MNSRNKVIRSDLLVRPLTRVCDDVEGIDF